MTQDNTAELTRVAMARKAYVFLIRRAQFDLAGIRKIDMLQQHFIVIELVIVVGVLKNYQRTDVVTDATLVGVNPAKRGV
jgi:hypothetical protein